MVPMISLAVKTHALELEKVGDVLEVMRTNRRIASQYAGMGLLYWKLNVMMGTRLITRGVLAIVQES